MRDEAAMYFHTVSLQMRMLNSKGMQQFKVTDAYRFLWTDKEIEYIKRAEYKAKGEALRQRLLASSTKPGGK